MDIRFLFTIAICLMILIFLDFSKNCLIFRQVQFSANMNYADKTH